VLTLAAGASFTPTSTAIAAVYVTVDIEFSKGSNSDNSDVLVMCKANAYTGNTLYPATTNFSLSTLFEAIQTKSGQGYVESTYDTTLTDGSFIYLPVGYYYFNMTLGLSGAPGTSTLGLNIQSAAAKDSNDLLTATVTALSPPEYYSDPPVILQPSNGLTVLGTMRVTVPSTGFSYFQWNPVWTTQNSVSLQQMTLQIQRMGGVLTSKFSNPFPYGNNGNVDYFRIEGGKTTIVRRKPEVVPVMSISLSQYQDFLELRRKFDMMSRSVSVLADSPVVVEQQEDEKTVTVRRPLLSRLL